MALSNAPGEWRWEQRGNKWWRIHDVLNIEDGPHDAVAGVRVPRRRTVSCDARIRPMVPANDTEIACIVDGEHTEHEGDLRDFAWPGSLTVVKWMEDDRRTFHGEWPGSCPGCTLPLGHRGNHAP